MRKLAALSILYSVCVCAALASDWVVYEGKSGPGKGKNLVFLTGDEEYRSEEGMPQMAKILAERHGFHCTVLFPIKDGVIDPNDSFSLAGAEAIDSADAIIMQLRFRQWPDETMKHFVDAYLAGKPFIALRTSTHAFQYKKGSDSPYAKFSWESKEWPGGFGKQVLGETWVSHLGENHKEATRGIIEPSAQNDPIMRGVSDIFGDSGVYTVHPPPDAKILLRGEVLNGVHPGDPPLEGRKNNPMQPVAWTREYRNEAGKVNKIFCSTMGAATDFESEGLRRLVVNSIYWSLGMDIPEKADVRVVGDYKPTAYGFNGFVKGVKPDDLKIGEK
jgi:type 1 glutamine amidotransferase